MSHDDQDLRNRIVRLEERLARVEEAIDLPAPVAKKKIPEWIRPVETATAPPVAPPSIDAPEPPPLPPPLPMSPPDFAPIPPLAPAPAPSLPQRPTNRPRPTRPLRIATNPPPRTTTPFELIVGGKWMAWVGALAVVASVAFFLAFAVQKGWWSMLTEPVRCLLSAAFGVLLIGGGELAWRRIGRAASVGLFGAGLSVLYLVAWAASVRYDLVTPELSFLMMGAVAVIGFAVTVRTRFLTIGVLSLLGGYATPLLLSGIDGHDAQRLCYLTMLLGIALGLSAVRPAPFRPLRYVALGAHAFPALAWLLDRGDDHWAMAIVFLSVWWTMLLVECTLAALREQTPGGNIVATLLATAAYVTCGTWILGELKPPAEFDWLGSFTASIAVLCAAVALHFGPGLDALRGRARTAMDRLALALWVQASVLVAVAVALQFDGYGQSIGWLAVGVAAIELSRRLPSRGVGVFGIIVGVLAVGRIALVDWWAVTGFSTAFRQWGDVQLTHWGILAVAAIAAMHLVARRLGTPSRDPDDPFRPWPVLPALIAVVGTFGWLAVAGVHCRDHAMTWAWLPAPAALFAAARYGVRLRYFETGIGVLVLIAGKWLLIDALLARLQVDWNPGDATPVLNGQMALAVGIAAVGVWAYAIMQRRERAFAAAVPAGSRAPFVTLTAPVQAVLVLFASFLLVALSFEVDRLVGRLAGPGVSWSLDHVRDLSLTLLWAIGGTGLGLVGRAAMRRHETAGGAGRPLLVIGFAWLVLGACAAKWILFDTLFWTAQLPDAAIRGALPVGNLQMAVGAVLAAGAMLLLAISRTAAGEGRSRLLDHASGLVPVAASVMVLWGLSFEVDRILARLAADGLLTTAWPPALLRAFWWTILWATGGVAMQLAGRVRAIGPMISAGWGIAALACIAWLGPETFGERLRAGPVDVLPIVNIQFAVGVVVAGLLAAATVILRRSPRQLGTTAVRLSGHVITALVIIGAIGLWLGTLEIDRVTAAQLSARQPGFSVYWCLCAVVLIVIGFARRAPIARYVGIGLFAVTTMKVFIVDLSQVELVWRWVSFLALGLLLIGTSMLYAKLAPRVGEHGAPTG